MLLIVTELETEALWRVAKIVRAVSVTSKKVGARANVLSDFHWRRQTASTWARSASQEERKAWRIGLVHTRLHNGDGYKASRCSRRRAL